MLLGKGLLFSLSILIILFAGAFGNSYVNTFYDNFTSGVHLPVYVTQGNNVSTLTAWDGSAMAVNTVSDAVKIDIYNYTISGGNLFTYNSVEEWRYDFWIGGSGSFSANIYTYFGNIFENTPNYNYIIVHMDGASSRVYGGIYVKNITLIYGNNKGDINSQRVYINYDQIIKGHFTLDVDFRQYPNQILFTFYYPNANGVIFNTIGSIPKPLKIGIVSHKIVAGQTSSPYEIYVNINGNMRDKVFLMDNLYIQYKSVQNQIENQTPITVPIGVSLFVAIPVIIYGLMRKKFSQKLK